MLRPIVVGRWHLRLLAFTSIDVCISINCCCLHCAEFALGLIKRVNHIVFFYTMCMRVRFILYDFVALGQVKDLGEGFDGKKNEPMVWLIFFVCLLEIKRTAVDRTAVNHMFGLNIE